MPSLAVFMISSMILSTIIIIHYHDANVFSCLPIMRSEAGSCIANTDLVKNIKLTLILCLNFSNISKHRLGLVGWLIGWRGCWTRHNGCGPKNDLDHQFRWKQLSMKAHLGPSTSDRGWEARDNPGQLVRPRSWSDLGFDSTFSLIHLNSWVCRDQCGRLCEHILHLPPPGGGKRGEGGGKISEGGGRRWQRSFRISVWRQKCWKKSPPPTELQATEVDSLGPFWW